MGNIVGEPFKDYVEKQIQKRQEIHGKTEREPQDIVYLNSTLAWVKLASSVSLTEERLDMLKDSYGNKIATGVTPGKELAMQNVLFNGITNFGSTRLKNEEDLKSDFSSKEFLDFMNSNEKESFNTKGGKQKTTFLGNDGAYGMGGREFGIVPMPGITSIDSQDLNRGSIKKSRIQIKAYNKQQFDIIDVLYLRLGYTVLLEFGNSHYFDSGDDLTESESELKPMGSTLIDKSFFKKDLDYYSLLEKIEKNRRKNRGNYDAVLGKVVNFTWTFDKDGTYNIDLDIISVGDVIESLKINLPPIKSIGDEINYAQNQAKLNILKNKVADDMDEFYVLYPALKKQLKEWWEGFTAGSTIQTLHNTQEPHAKFLMPNNSLQVIYGKYEPFGLMNNTLTDREIPANVSATTSDYSGYLTVTVPDSMETDALAKTQVDKFLNPAVKFAIILQYQGQYSGLSKDGSSKYKKDISGSLTNAFGDTLTRIEDVLPAQPELKGGTLGDNSNTANNSSYVLGNPPIKTSVTPSPADILAVLPDGRIEYNFDPSKPNPYEYYFIPTNANYAKSRYNLAQKNALFNAFAYGLSNASPTVQGYTEDQTAAYMINGQGISLLQIKGRFTDLGSSRSQKTLANNLLGGFDVFERLILEYFKKADAAGGPNDNRLSSNPTFPSYAIELEFEKNKDRIHQWLYLVRKYYTGITDAHALRYGGRQIDPGEVYGPISINGPSASVKVGKIINPYDVANYNLIKNPTNISAYKFNVEYRKILYKAWNDFVTYPKYDNSNSNHVDLFVLDKFSKASGGTGEFNLDGTGKFKFFVRLGCLLRFLEEQLIPTILPSDKTTGRKVPLLKIDTDTKSNICYVVDNVMSTNIKSIIVRNDQFKAIRSNVFKTNKLFEGIEHFVKPGSDFSYGRIMNIYINFESIQTQLDKAKGQTNDAILFDFLKGLCDEVNKSLGNVNNLEPVIDHETNIIKIIDQTPIPGLDDILKSLENEDGTKAYPRFKIKKPTILQMYGYNGDISNFVKNIGIQTSISKEYASMITIGATANGSVPGMEATAFSRWNTGVLDRVKPEIVDGSINDYSKVSLIAQNEEVVNRYIKMITLDDKNEQFRLLGLSKDGSFNATYEAINPEIVSDYYNFAQAESASSGSLESSVGFLPFNLKIDMDGLSGIKIYNRIHVDTRFLPSNYPETLDFIVTKVNQKVTNNKWDTSLETIATKIIDKANPKDSINTPNLINSKIPITMGILPIKANVVFNAGPNPTKFINGDTNAHLYNIPNVPDGGEISVAQIVECFHPEVRNSYRKFLTRLQNETSGWIFTITATFRLLTRSSQFFRKHFSSYDKCVPTSPSGPGKSPHGYGIGLDVVAKRTDTGKKYRFPTNAVEWAQECPYVFIGMDEGFDWGGDIVGYEDPVHFTAITGDNGKRIDYRATRNQIFSVLGKTSADFNNTANPELIAQPAIDGDLFFMAKGGVTNTSLLYTPTLSPTSTAGGGTRYIDNFQDNGTTYVLPTVRKGMYSVIPLKYK